MVHLLDTVIFWLYFGMKKGNMDKRNEKHKTIYFQYHGSSTYTCKKIAKENGVGAVYSTRWEDSWTQAANHHAQQIWIAHSWTCYELLGPYLLLNSSVFRIDQTPCK